MNLDLSKIRTTDNQTVTICRMSSHTMIADLLSYGAAIHSIHLLDGSPDPCADRRLALSLDTVSGYLKNPLYAGATLAPNAGRISNGSLPLPQGHFSLSQNDGRHQLHGGFSNLSFCNWDITATQKSLSSCSVTFSCRLPDGIDGYPGNRRFSVCYRLTDDNALMIRYHAESDCPTYINMANHTYFNLLGDYTVPVCNHRITAAASRYTELRPDHIPVRIAACSGTPFDFSRPRSLKEQAKKYPCHPQLEIGHGYNHGFLLDFPCDFSGIEEGSILPRRFQMQPSLTLEEPLSGRTMQVYTDAPCIVLYSGGFIGGDTMLEKGIPSTDFCALAVECQDVPDTPNLAPEKMRLTTPSQPFERTILYQF